MAVLYLVRHGHNDFVGKGIAGRRSGIHLDEKGLEQAQEVARLLEKAPLVRVLSSPRERTRETAEPVARRFALPVEISDGLDEIDFGQWEGALFGQLEDSPQWRLFNRFRSNTRIPSGEMMVETQARMVATINAITKDEPKGHIAVFSHGDPIKLVLAHYAGIPIDLSMRLEIGLGSISVMELTDGFARILCINHTANGPAMP